MLFKVVSLMLPIFFFSLTLKDFSTPDKISERILTYLFILIHGSCLIFTNMFTLWAVLIFQIIFLIGLLSLVITKLDEPKGVLYYYMPISILLITQQICKL